MAIGHVVLLSRGEALVYHTAYKIFEKAEARGTMSDALDHEPTKANMGDLLDESLSGHGKNIRLAGSVSSQLHPRPVYSQY